MQIIDLGIMSVPGLLRRFPKNWNRKINRLLRNSWSELYQAIQTHHVIEIPYVEKGKMKFLIIKGFHEVNDKYYYIY